MPLYTGLALRYDTNGDFENRKSWSKFDLTPFKIDMCVGSVFDGRFLYYVPYSNGKVVRYDTLGDFENITSWQSYNAEKTGGLETEGFDGGFFDGRYVYFEPFSRKFKEETTGRLFHSDFLRYDTRGKFDDPGSWTSYDASRTNNLETIGYNGGAFDGRFFYLAPCFNADYISELHGRILRYDTTGANASFSLRYCDYGHNGGLCAAVPGPGFIVNTTTGPVSIFANRILVPGMHHIAGVYNGDTIKLFVDGVLVNERSGSGSIQTNNVKVVIGRLHETSTRFNGSIVDVRISNIARNDNWIKTVYRNLVNPTDFVRIGEEEVIK